ncbi:MAG: hypothetical protein KGZ62_10915 [Sulfurimonas sp.]|nr:hypothetical protein [Sulfurimonas sp.]
MENTKLTLTQKVAIFWLKNIDSQLILFNQLKTLHQGFRLFLYAALIVFAIFFMKFVSSLVGGYFESAPMPEWWYFVGNIIFYSVVTGAFLIVTLETVFNIDVFQILANMKEQKRLKKELKLQRWRLRNIRLGVRIAIYISFYMFLVFIFQLSFIGLMIDITQTTTLTKEQIQALNDEYAYILRWVTYIYLLSALTLDYFVNKKTRAVKAQKEVQNETL